MLNPSRLHVLREVARCGSLSAASRVLALSQSAVSQQIAALEDEAGAALFERTARGVHLTEAGRCLMQRSERIALELREAERELEALASGEAGQVRLGAFATAASTLVAQAIGALRSTAPSIDVHLVDGDPKRTLPLLEAGELDLTLDFDYDVLPDPGSATLIRTVIREDPFRVALPAGHRYARRRKLRLVDLAGETWIGGPAYACTELLRWLCARAGFQPRVGFETSDYGTVQGLIVAGVGVALIPSLALPNLRDGLAAYELTDARAHRRIRLVRRATAHLSGATRRVWEAIEAAARSFPLHPAAQTRSRARSRASL